MKNRLFKDQRGMSQVLIILLVVIVLGGVGYAGWTIKQKNNDGGLSSEEKAAITPALKSAEKDCIKEMNDKDLCKFFTNSIALGKKMMVVSTSKTGGETSTVTTKIDGDNTYIKMDGSAAMEIITIGDTTYTHAGSVWYSQTTKKTTTTPAEDTTPKVNKDDYTFEAPKTEESTTKYVKVGKEACGDKTCFKYKIVDSADTSGSMQYIWFDDDAYLLRKMRTEDKDGSTSEMVFSYDNVSVTKPSPVKALGENQYILPGATEPTTLPSAADFNLPQ